MTAFRRTVIIESRARSDCESEPAVVRPTLWERAIFEKMFGLDAASSSSYASCGGRKPSWRSAPTSYRAETKHNERVPVEA
jgi:hypothetical protein